MKNILKIIGTANVYKIIPTIVFIILLLAIGFLLGKVQTLSERLSTTKEMASQVASASTEPTPSPSPTLTPTPSPVKAIQKKSASVDCNKVGEDFIKNNNNLYALDDYLIANYRECHYKLLSDNNLPKTDENIRVFYQNGGRNQSNNSYDQWKQNQTQDCVKRQAEYASCLAEYNSKLIEYNNCILDSFKKTYGFCSQPMNSCFKPLCSCLFNRIDMIKGSKTADA